MEIKLRDFGATKKKEKIFLSVIGLCSYLIFYLLI